MSIYLKIMLVMHFSTTLCVPSFLAPAEGLSCAEVVELCKISMEPPLTMAVSRNGTSSLVFQKRLEGGEVAQRVEHLGKPLFVQISTGSRSFDLFPDSKVALESSIFIQQIQAAAGNLATDLHAGPIASLSDEFRSMTESEYGGSPCWVVITQMPMSFLENVASKIPERASKLPSEFRYFVNKSTGMMVYSELRTADGQRMAETSYTDIQKSQDLSDDLFSVPESWSVITPASKEDYLKHRLELRSRTRDLDSRVTHRQSKITPEMMERPWEHLGLEKSEFYKSVEASRRAKREKLVSNMEDSLVPRSRSVFLDRLGHLAVVFFIVWINVRTYLHFRYLRKRKKKDV
jgi:hypothetical protein